jgi:hypothetical protein
MNQNIWGPPLWFSLHSITFTYPLNPTPIDKSNYKKFFASLENVLPCAVCRKNYLRHLNESPIDNALKSRKDLVEWMIDLHNLVNAETGKKFVSKDKVLKRYEEIYGKKIILNENDDNIINTNTPLKNTHNFFFENIKTYRNQIIIIILILIIIILMMNILFKKNRIILRK